MGVSARSGFRDSPGVAPARPWARRICGVPLLGMIMFCLAGCSGGREAAPSGGGGSSDSGGDMPDGVSFRGIAWGTDISQMPDMSRTEDGSWPGLRYYSRQGDRLAFGDASLASLTYAAFKDRFFRVDFEAVPGQALKLSQALAAEYGQPRRKEGAMNEWAVKTPKGETVEITFDTEGNLGWIIFQPIEDELLQDMDNPPR